MNKTVIYSVLFGLVVGFITVLFAYLESSLRNQPKDRMTYTKLFLAGSVSSTSVLFALIKYGSLGFKGKTGYSGGSGLGSGSGTRSGMSVMTDMPDF